MKKTIIAAVLAAGLTAAVAFTSGSTFAQMANDGKMANQNMGQMTMPANDMGKMPINERMAMMGDMMNSCGSMMKQQGMNMKFFVQAASTTMPGHFTTDHCKDCFSDKTPPAPISEKQRQPHVSRTPS